MTFFDGLYSYEVVLLVLGALFFLVLLVAFVILLVRGKPLKPLLLFFAISIVMIGYPSIKSISIQGDLITIEKNTNDLRSNPTNGPLRSTLSKEVAVASTRPLAGADALTRIATAQFALGDHTAAESNLQKALQQSPQLAVALDLKNRIDLDHRLTALSAQVEQHPDDAAGKQNLQKTVSEASRLSVASPVFMANIARAQAVIGNHAAAQFTAEKALAIDPNLTTAKKVQMQMRATRVQP